MPVFRDRYLCLPVPIIMDLPQVGKLGGIQHIDPLSRFLIEGE
jgi:hypothetical protein